MMPTASECICCHEIDNVVQKIQESGKDINCIVDHDGFDPVCLNVWVLQAAYYSYRQRYGSDDDGKAVNE